jgi:lauroyl/myristoyl acyltransferase
MKNLCLRFNYQILDRAISLFNPQKAYRCNFFTGCIGKSLSKSYRFSGSILEEGLSAISTVLQIDNASARRILRRFFLIETRVHLEHTWLSNQKWEFLPEIIDMDTLKIFGNQIQQKNPVLILTAHTAYYFVIPWALHALGIKIAYVTSDPRRNRDTDNLLKGISAVITLEKVLPVIYTDDKNTVQKCIDYLQKGYSVIMVIDVPGYKDKGTVVKFMNKNIWLPSGYSWIYKEIKPEVYAMFSYVSNLQKPYSIVFQEIKETTSSMIIRKWIKLLEEVVLLSPESWLGWFYLRHMTEN